MKKLLVLGGLVVAAAAVAHKLNSSHADDELWRQATRPDERPA
ncbi:MAG: DLW-39 family protein [Actinomycetia bacterium]|nr:DLW-39 family protein [Actinomycetes bacterium]